MITGFNTDVKYRGLVYHVQTEDKGPQNPLIETLVYKGGEILASRRLPYGELIKGHDEAAITKLMEDQHKGMMMEVKKGKFTAEPTRRWSRTSRSTRSCSPTSPRARLEARG